MAVGMYIQDDYWEAAQCLSEKQRGEFFNALATYHFTGDAPKVTGIVAACFTLCKGRVDAAKRSTANGRKGGRPRKHRQNPEPNPDETHGFSKTLENANPEPNPDETHGFSKTLENANPEPNPDETQTEPTLLKSKSKSKSKEKDPKGSKEKERRKTFAKPTLEQVTAYVTEKGYHFSPAAFVDHYESNGWMVGRNPMRNWKSACATWEHNDFGVARSKQQVGGGERDVYSAL